MPNGEDPDASGSPSADGAIADGAQGNDATQDTTDGAHDGASADAGYVGPDAADAATASACEGDAALPPDAGLPAAHVCSFHDGGAEFPLFAKCCASADDCALGVYQNSCCGDTFAYGLNTSQVDAFDRAVTAWSCAACGCLGAGLRTEDGAQGVTDAGVRCDHGWCRSYAQ